MSIVVHIDGDIIVYSVGFAANDGPVENALHSCKVLLARIMRETDADDYVLHLTGKGNFRDDLATIQGYKDNRKDAPKPHHYEAIRTYLCKKFGAYVSEGMEADDTIGIALTSDTMDTLVLASLDKDLNMIPGAHYNWRKSELFYIDEDEADKFFIEQLLTGDSTDNIPGLKRITGKVATRRIKQYCTEPDEFTECVDRVRETYLEHAPDLDVDAVLHEIGNLLWIRRYGYDTWEAYYKDRCQDKAESTEDTSG